MIVQQIVALAMRRAQGVQATMLTQEISTVDFDNDRLKSAASSQRTKIEVKVIVEGKVGSSSTTDLGDLDGVIRRAIEAAAFGSPAYFELPGPHQIEAVKSFDPALLSLQKPEMICLGQKMMAMLKAYNPEILAGAAINKEIYRFEYANSKGASYSAEHTNFTVGVMGQLVRGTDILYAGHGVGQKKRQVDEEDIVARAIAYFHMAEKIVPLESGEMPIIFTPVGLAALLLSLGMALDGKNVYLGTSPLGNKLGQPIAAPSLTLVDDPLCEFGPNTSAFDNEGVPRKVTPLIEKGVLKNFIYDLDTAGRAQTQPTGHGSNRQLTNLIIDPGNTPYAAMLSGIENGLLVHRYLGLGHGNPITGEFSVNIRLGYKIEHGKIAGRVKDVMLAGNAFDAIKDISAISQEREWVSGPFAWFSGLFPYVQVRKMSATAK